MGRSGGGGKNWGDTGKVAVITAKWECEKETSGVSRLLGAAKLQSAHGADYPRYAAAFTGKKLRKCLL